MLSKSKSWFLLSLLLFAASFLMWRYADKRVAARHAAEVSKLHSAATPHSAATLTKVSTAANRPKSYRLSNTTAKSGDLLRNSHVILLRNATIDTSRPLDLDIPAHLRAKGAPGSYIVQSDRPLDPAFYNQLKKDGADYVSYIPNDAALVRAGADAAQSLTNDAFFQAVVPYEPYYKLDSSLLPTAVDQTPENSPLSVTVFPGQRDAALAALTSLGAQLMGEDKTPFGPTLVVNVPPDSLAAVAQLPNAWEVERYTPRRTMNDLTRVQLGISSTTLIGGTNYLGLDGTGVTVNLNDTGVDGTHPDFAARLLGYTQDFDGHGTHVAGIIASDGAESATVPGPVPGSIIPGADFRGKATNATLFVQNLDLLLGPFLSDSDLIQTASVALKTNLISNNSWGYGTESYDMHAATFDAATRDAQPFATGEQPMLFVFAAGNNGDGDDTGIDGHANTITSPGTAKNVITVGASDSPRFITNLVDYSSDDINSTNGSPVFLGETDNSNLVAYFSSCGNVDVGVEGVNGRFKPDVVAPGAFIASCRATDYQVPTNQTYVTYYPYTNQVVSSGQTNYYSYFYIPPDTSEIILQIQSNTFSPNPFPSMAILGNDTYPPQTILGTNLVFMTNISLADEGGTFYFGVTPTARSPHPISYDLNIYLIETNYLGNYFEVISNLDNGLGKYYRFETGTSMSAPAVSGLLALMQQFLETRMKPAITNPTPALLKAMLINGSRSIDYLYDFNVNPSGPNEQGWGLPNIVNSIPGSLTNGPPSMVLVNQSTNDALATGQSQSYTVNCTDPAASNSPVRITLVWTDPPGNPAAGVALVNDLGLEVTDSTGTNYYIGNNFAGGDVFTEVSSVTNTSFLPAALASANFDTINNVQNVYIGTQNNPIAFPLTVTVLGNHVNVNAVTTESNLIAQDYALVISSDDTALASPLTVTSNAVTPPTAPTLTNAVVTVASNGVPLLHERVGANEPNVYDYTVNGTNGDLSGWHFFIFTNNVTGTNALTNSTQFGANVAFATFYPPELSVPRSDNNADIDMYVARSSVMPNTFFNLTNLDATVIQQSDKSLTRTGTETVIYTNSPSNEVFCVGIKSEDQQGADFGFYAVAQEAPFSSQNADGSVTATGTSLPVSIPDISTQGALVFAFLINPNNPSMVIRKVTIDDGLQSQNADALYGTVQHNGTTAVINNFTGNPSGFTNLYDDLPDNNREGSVTTDPPGTLKNFVGQSGQGVWQLTETDYAPFLVGQVNQFTVTAYPEPPGNDFTITISNQSWFYNYVQVPNDATNMTITVIYEDNSSGPVGIFVTNTDNVNFGDYGVSNITQPGGYLSYGTTNTPPLTGGLWFYGIYNYNALQNVTLNVQIQFQESLVPNLVETFSNNTLTPLLTDGTTVSAPICINNGDHLVDLSVGLVVADTNLDDLVIHLTSPQGTSVLLFEDRGGTNAANLGLYSITNGTTNFTYTVFTEDTNLAAVPIKFAPTPFASSNISRLKVLSANTFEGQIPTNYTNGQSVGQGWTVSSNEVSIVSDVANSHSGSNFLAITTGHITNSFPTVPGGTYELRYWVKPPQITDWWPADDSAIDLVNTNDGYTTNIIYDVGEVARAFTFDGVDSEVGFDTNVGNFGNRDYSVDFWIKTSVSNEQYVAVIEKRPGCSSSNFWDILLAADPNNTLFSYLTLEEADAFGNIIPFSSQIKVNDGLYHHAAITRQGTNLSWYIDGTLNTNTTAPIDNLFNNSSFRFGRSVCESGNGTFPFSGDLDEVDLWGRALSPAEVHAIYAAESAGKYSTNSLYPNLQVQVDGVSTNTVIVTNFTGGWQLYTNSFVATNTSVTLELSGQTLSVLLDDLRLYQLPLTNYSNYFLPEEPLSNFIGENPTGCWTLSIQDTRDDSSFTNNGVLLSWTLDATISSTNADVIVLTNGIAYTNTATNITYFGVDVPLTANFATNMLISSTAPVNVLFNQAALPTGALPGDVTFISGGTQGTNTIGTQGGPPPLVPGRRYFIGVQDLSSAPVTFTFEVQFDVGANTNIVTLTNEQAVVTNAVTTNGGQFYVFPNVPTNATMVTFQLLGVTTGEVDLYAREGLPVPGPLSFDYQSRNNGSNDQFIVITTNSEPVSLPTATTNDLTLTPTTWYLSVYPIAQMTNGTNIVGTNSYTIIATYVTNNPVGGGSLKVQPLANGIPFTNTAFPGYPTNILYSFTVNNSSNAATELEFVVSNYMGVGNLELLVDDGSFPTPQNFYSGSFNSGSGNQIVVVSTNADTTNFSGIWYLAVPNTSSNTVPYTITATIVTNAISVQPAIKFLAASVSPTTGGFSFSWSAVPGTNYSVDVTTNLLNWSVVTNVVATSSIASYTDPTPVKSQTSRFFRVTAP